MKKLLALSVSLLTLAGSSYGQETTSTGEAGVVAVTPQAPATQTAQPAPDYVRSVHEDWAIKCSPADNLQCFMTQLIIGENNQPLMEIVMVPAKITDEPNATMLGTITTPLNVILPRGLLLQVDEELPDQKVFRFCSQIGCHSQFPIFPEQIDLYKRAAKMTVVLFHMSNPNQGLEFPMSLKGFTAAHETLMKIEAGELTPEPVNQEASATETPTTETSTGETPAAEAPAAAPAEEAPAAE